MAVVAKADTCGFCWVLVKLFGPAHEKEVPISEAPVRFSGLLVHTGELLPAVAVGIAFFTKGKTAVDAEPKVGQPTETTTSQVPTGIVAVDCDESVPSKLAVGLPTGP